MRELHIEPLFSIALQLTYEPICSPLLQLAHPAIQLAWRRAKAGSRPGARTDGAKLGLVVEGGGMRGVISAGSLMMLYELGLRWGPCTAAAEPETNLNQVSTVDTMEGGSVCGVTSEGSLMMLLHELLGLRWELTQLQLESMFGAAFEANIGSKVRRHARRHLGRPPRTPYDLRLR